MNEDELLNALFLHVEENYHMIASINYEEQLINIIEKTLINHNHIIHISSDKFNEIVNTLFPIPRQLIHHLSSDDNNKDKVDYLLSLNNHSQGSPEWYIKRGTLLTASNSYKAFGSDSSKNSLIYEKCQAFNGKAPIFSTVNMPISLEWGHMFEPASVALYEYMFDTKIGNLGCMAHPQYDFIGASPDGINILDSSPLYGRIIEIKNVLSRVIDGYPTMEYWIQMQQQMEVCNIDLCDFIETKYYRYDYYNDFVEDSLNDNIMRSKCENIKGIVIHTIDGFESLPIIDMCKEDWDEYHTNLVDELGNKWIRTIYYRLDDWSCVVVPRNKKWFDKVALPTLSNLWNTINTEKNIDYSHRAPKKRIKKTNCMFDSTVFNIE
jgi:hypothetical protein